MVSNLSISLANRINSRRKVKTKGSSADCYRSSDQETHTGT
jgi:hypothetical protein